jgi:hypothetical protein
MSDKRLTAAEAREIAGPTFDEIVNLQVDSVCVLIREAATRKERNVVPRDSFWVDGGYSNTKEWLAAKGILETMGYTVKFIYEERQFVEMYTCISW